MRTSCLRPPHRAVRASCGAVTAIRRNNMSTSATTTRKPIALFLNASRLDYDRQLGTFRFPRVIYTNVKSNRPRKMFKPLARVLSITQMYPHTYS